MQKQFVHIDADGGDEPQCYILTTKFKGKKGMVDILEQVVDYDEETLNQLSDDMDTGRLDDGTLYSDMTQARKITFLKDLIESIQEEIPTFHLFEVMKGGRTKLIL